ncbi:hypothetical protein [Streptomyces sp. GQFP]|uniref:hypothetical protein n=1 Tax=Streptomyces sp. GQFP TaxID=2907545 RepID=UPI001F45D495|nr:hypothetical protein [Streptomyces sp. GQFP]UIX31966.1 hypothetical protein LUX31_19055 [Streptomyces sp. GQFP]
MPRARPTVDDHPGRLLAVARRVRLSAAGDLSGDAQVERVPLDGDRVWRAEAALVGVPAGAARAARGLRPAETRAGQERLGATPRRQPVGQLRPLPGA